ncbi:MAG: hypothetical protein H0X71_08220 [Rubrobacter sp.]|nr:hypothetical protein [Rubrobacter sp.]
MIALAVASIASYFYVGVFDLWGNVDKAIEVLLAEASISRFRVQRASSKGRPLALVHARCSHGGLY